MKPFRLAQLLLAGLLAPGIAPAADPPAAPEASEIEALQSSAREAFDQRDYGESIKLYRRAVKQSGSRCAPCQVGLAKAYSAAGAYKDAAASAQAALALTDDTEFLAVAWNEIALAQFADAGMDVGKLTLAEASFRKVLALDPSPITRFNLGVTLVRLSRTEEGIVELRSFAESAPRSAKAKTALDIIDNPRRARESMLPSLELVTLDGKFVTNEDLAGKVVLIDFWGTWCAPCRAAVPSLKALVERSKKLPLVVLSVSNDSDEAALTRFVAEHGMTWPQVWDRKQGFVHEMGVEGFPTYLLADHEGVIVFRYSGWSENVDRAIQDQIRRAVAKAKRSGAAVAP